MNHDTAEKLVDALIDACEIHAAMLILGTQESTNHLSQIDELCDDLRDCVISELTSNETQIIPIYPDKFDKSSTWYRGPVTCKPVATWTSADSLDGKVS